jgi:hypothetical protein
MSPPEFYKVAKDLVTDLSTTFPELLPYKNAHLTLIAGSELAEQMPPELQAAYDALFEHMLAVFPSKIMDVLAQNDSIFEQEFLIFPEVDLAFIWKLPNITAKTKETIWKYLKLFMLLIVGNISDGSAFGERFNNADLQQKMEEATADIHKFFTDTKLPDPASLKEHMEGLMGGKLGALAKEIADETVGDASPEKLQGMLKNPSEMMGLVKKVGDKIDSQIKSGKLKESELLAEATEMLGKINEFPGIKEMMQKFGGAGKMDMASMQSKLNQNLKKAKTKERLQKKCEERKFSTGEKVERTPVPDKKKKNKKKKKKNISNDGILDKGPESVVEQRGTLADPANESA